MNNMAKNDIENFLAELTEMNEARAAKKFSISFFAILFISFYFSPPQAGNLSIGR
jgi:hypothetical protein